MRASKCCEHARTFGADGATVGPSEPPQLGRALQDGGRARVLVLPGEDAVPAGGRRRALIEGARHRPRPVAPSRLPGGRRAHPAWLRHPPRGRHGPALADHRADRRRPGRRGPRDARAPPDAGGVRRRAHAGGAGRPLHRPPPHRRKDPPLVNDRLRLTDANRRWWTLAAMCFALAMVMLDNTVTNVALPSIQRSFDASLSALEWTINAYPLSFAVLLVTGGRLGDIFGRRKVFLIGVVIFAASSATIGLAPSEGWLVASRAVQGMGAALMMPATLSIITNAFPPRERGKAIGTWAGVSALALAIGPVGGGFLVENVSWQSLFFLNLPVAALAVVVTLFAAHESRDETSTHVVDLPGVATITVGLAALVLALVEGNAWGWGSARIVVLLAVAATMLVAFMIAERGSPEPMVDFRFFRSRSYLGANLVAFVVSFAMLAMFFFLALYMQNILGYSPLQAGVRFLPSTLCVMAVGPIAGRLTDRLGPRNLIVTGLLIVAAALAWQSQLDVDTTYAFLLPGFVAMGIGIA